MAEIYGMMLLGYISTTELGEGLWERIGHFIYIILNVIPFHVIPFLIMATSRT